MSFVHIKESCELPRRQGTTVELAEKFRNVEMIHRVSAFEKERVGGRILGGTPA
jgi:hypothetical protein